MEGNTLTISETKILLEDGITVGGRPLKDCYEAVGHGAAYDFMLELAAMAHKRLVDIHPFIDGNGRTARLLMNLILVNAGYGVASIPPILRNDYINALSASRRLNDMEPFSKLIAECVIETERDYCRLLKL